MGFVASLAITQVIHKNSKKLQTPNQACRENDTAQRFTKTLANIPLSTRELRNRPPKKSDFVIFFLSFFLSSFSYKTLDQHSLQTKAVIEVLHTQNDIAFVIVAPFSPFVCKSSGFGSFQLCEVLTQCHFEKHTGRGSDVRVPIAHAQFTCKRILPLLIMFAFEVLTESLTIQHLVVHNHQQEFLPTCTCPCLT